MSARPIRSFRAWSPGPMLKSTTGGTLVAFAAALLSGCPGNAGLANGGSAGSPPPGASPGPTYTVAYRVGDAWDAHDDRLEVYDRRRWFWLDVRDARGKPPPEPPQVAVLAPPGFTPAQVYEVQKEQNTDRFFVRVRFYEPGRGYRLAVQAKSPRGESEVKAFDLPEVMPALREAGALRLSYTASPALGKPMVPAILTIRVTDSADRAVSLDKAPKIRLTNPCGWGPHGTFSPVPGEIGAYSFEVPGDEMIDVTGTYKIKVFPLTDPASYVEYTYETR